MRRAQNQNRAAGVALVVVSAAVFSTAGIFTRGVEAGSWTIIFWRGLAAAVFTLGYLLLRRRFRQEVRAFDRRAGLVAVTSAAGTAAFIPAFKLSSVANVTMIYAAAPFLAAALSWLFIGEVPTRRVMVSSGLALIGVGVIVSGSFEDGAVLGDMLALWMTLMMAAVMVVYRKWPATPAALPNAVSSLLLLPVAIGFGVAIPSSAGSFSVLLLFGLVFAVASVTLSEGARRLPSAEVALLSTLETPLAPVLALLVLAEPPSLRTALGGGIILVAVLGSQRRGPRTKARALIQG